MQQAGRDLNPIEEGIALLSDAAVLAELINEVCCTFEHNNADQCSKVQARVILLASAIWNKLDPKQPNHPLRALERNPHELAHSLEAFHDGRTLIELMKEACFFSIDSQEETKTAQQQLAALARALEAMFVRGSAELEQVQEQVFAAQRADASFSQAKT